MHVVFTGFLTNLTNMIIKIQFIYTNVQKRNPRFTSYFNIGYLMSMGTLELAIRWHLLALAFKTFSENQSNILCILFSSFSKIGIMSGREVYGVASSAKLAYSKFHTSKKRSHI